MSIDKVPKKPVVHQQKEPATTLKALLTENDTKPYMIDYLKTLSKTRGPWGKYFEFYLANQSGSIASMKSDIKKYAEALVREVYFHHDENSAG